MVLIQPGCLGNALLMQLLAHDQPQCEAGQVAGSISAPEQHSCTASWQGTLCAFMLTCPQCGDGAIDSSLLTMCTHMSSFFMPHALKRG